MAMKPAARKVYKSMQGKEIDLDKLRAKNELTLAVGNARVNARGDELGPGGKIIKKREDVMSEYYSKHPDAVPAKQKTAVSKTKTVEDQDPFGEEDLEV
jgi:hypothetical protein